MWGSCCRSALMACSTFRPSGLLSSSTWGGFSAGCCTWPEAEGLCCGRDCWPAACATETVRLSKQHGNLFKIGCHDLFSSKIKILNLVGSPGFSGDDALVLAF